MSYDFFVFPAERADDLAAAIELYEAAPDRGVLTAGSAVAGLVAGLRADPAAAGSLLEADGHDGAAYVRTSWADPMANLRVVAGLARSHGLSVLDVQLDALYDPRGALDVSLDTEGGPRLPYLTRPLLATVLTQIRDRRYHWVTLARESGVYAQAFRDDDGSWAVEHRDGRHFAARTTDAVLVEELLWSWARGGTRWQAMLAFAPVEL